MGDNTLQSTVARPKVDKKKERVTFSTDPDLWERVVTLAERSEVSASRVVEWALRRMLPVFEADPGELMRKPEEP